MSNTQTVRRTERSPRRGLVSRATVLLVTAMVTLSVLTAPVAAASGVSLAPGDWTATGSGAYGGTTQGVATGPDGLELTWNYGGLYGASWTYTTTAQATEAYTFDWAFSGCHSWFRSDAKAYAFADGPAGRTTVLLADTGSCGFSQTGTTTLQVTDGYAFGIVVEGYHFDSSRLMFGTFTILDESPSLVATGGDEVPEGTAATVSATLAGLDSADSYTVEFDWGDGAVESVAVSAGQTSVAATHAYEDDGSYVATVSLLENGAVVGSDTAVTLVSNAAPVLSATVDDDALAGDSVSASGSFTDAGLADTHSVSIDWGDGTVESVAVTQGAGSGSFAASHAYATGGVYAVTVTVTDDDGGADGLTESVTVSYVVDVLVKPDEDGADDRNPINLRSNGVIPVAVLGSADLDVGDIDVSSLRFGDDEDVAAGGGASPAHGGHLEDVNGDGVDDLVLHVRTQDAGFEAGDTVGALAGLTVDGVPLVGADTVDAFAPGNGGNGASTADVDADDDDADDDEPEKKGKANRGGR